MTFNGFANFLGYLIVAALILGGSISAVCAAYLLIRRVLK